MAKIGSRSLLQLTFRGDKPKQSGGGGAFDVTIVKCRGMKRMVFVLALIIATGAGGFGQQTKTTRKPRAMAPRWGAHSPVFNNRGLRSLRSLTPG
jgi:hypothetical protein